jgi:UDP-GlcNAc:undecaprenyl-phosphate GlcNAc-1-phosphate transferase
VTGTWVAVSALVVTLVATPAVIVLARRTGIVDRPGALKPQSAEVPYLGGLAVWAGTMVGVLVGRPAVGIPLTAAMLLGVADDRFGLTPGVRLFGEAMIGVAVALTVPVRLPGAAGIPLIVVVAVLLINGVNLMDGLDMLAAGVAGIAAAAFAVALHGPGRHLGVALCAALVAFLVFNRPPARVYLGDGGSYLLGAALTVLLAFSWGKGVPTSVGAATLALVALPAAELAFAVIRRQRGRQSILAGDRGHPYDRLVARGWSPLAASLTYVAAEAVVATGVLVAVHLVSLTLAVAVDVFAAVVLTAAGLASGALVPDRGSAA